MNNRTARKAKWMTARLAELYPDKKASYRQVKRYLMAQSWTMRSKLLSKVQYFLDRKPNG